MKDKNKDKISKEELELIRELKKIRKEFKKRLLHMWHIPAEERLKKSD